MAVGAAGTPALAASTGVASVSGTTVTYKAGQQKTNAVTITRSGRTVTIDDRVTVKAGKGCKKVKGDRTRVRCTTATAPTRIKVFLYDRNDSLKNKTSIKTFGYAGTGDDKLTGGSAADRLVGDSGNDQIWGGAGNDSLDGGAGNDRITGGAGNDKEYGSTGNDTFAQVRSGRVDSDVMRGGPGRDTVSYATRTATVWISADSTTADDGQSRENDTVHTDVEVLIGGRGPDFLRAGDTASALYGNDGNDRITGGLGNDLLNGGNGADQVNGSAGDDRLQGGAGNDQLTGWSGDDLLDGGAGDDYLSGDDPDLETSVPIGTDMIRGGSGADRVDYNGHARPVVVDLDGVTGDDGQEGEHDTVGSDVEHLNGSPQSDVLTGNSAANYIIGGFGDDVIRGGGGTDTLYGGDGADLIHGEAGDDELVGGQDIGAEKPDLLDGGAGATQLGDLCLATDPDRTLDCERFTR
ncbi:Ca2+-binding RTX toxin-like protein [Actinoplanes lutulentus]|uniref:Hemolysin type calcium-binding protein n=1 Tax=Actinoplanes lutulentus TaxID=1287878 RepID=A0A327Z104_9ACTN|nr:calcium-binding protein [Actinoplanes lutulentus]MBB2945652.1 Ca2+-binding RTX toxin-like protein [Actinoplanes lutulentus]RAK27249.1 hemolysin type calcium-binding protein [Actinoplanes lutulentus]